MALSPQEIQIVQYGQKQGKSQADILKAVSAFRSTQPTQAPTAPQAPQTGYGPTNAPTQYGANVIDKVGTDLANRMDRTGQILARSDTNPVEKGLQVFGQGAGFAANTAETAVNEIPGVKQVTGAIGSGINWLAHSEWSPIKHLGDVIGKSKTLQDVVNTYDSDPNFRDTVDGVANIARIYGDASAVNDAGTFAANKARQVFAPAQEVSAFHGTTPANATSIKENGFDIKQARGGATEPVAVNLTSSPEEALKYADGKPDGVVQTTLRGKNIVTFKSPADYINTITAKFGDYTGPNATKFLKDYDGVVVKGAGANGADEMFSAYPKNIRVTNPSVTSTVDAGGGLAKTTSSTFGNAMKDVIPSSDQLVNHNITRALDLTQGDVRNISASTGNEVGEFIAKKNLIGETKDATLSKIDDFYKQNYKAVRSEISKVTDTYQAADVPRYSEALNAIKQKITDVPGLQSENTEVDALLKKTNPTLSDIQRAKELMDQHFSLYKATGDVGEGVAKAGLDNIRKNLKTFIEKQVKEKTGADIKELNNNVSTARSIYDAAESRSTRGLTRANLTLSDLSLFTGGNIVGGPLVGGALVLGKKLLQSSTIRLRISGFLDALSDAQKAKVAASLNKGVVPKMLERIVSSTKEP